MAVDSNRAGIAPRGAVLDIQELWTAFRNICFVILHLLVAGTFAYVVLSIIPGLHTASDAVPGKPHVNFAILLVHAFAALPPLLIGLIAFNPVLRRRSIGTHRSLGQIYCICIWVSSLTGILLASANVSGIWAQWGFGMLGVVWFATTTQAYRTAKPGMIPAHRVWMIRSYATTLAVVSVRPLLWFGPAEGFSVSEWVSLASWACWVPNLILAEFYLRITTFSGRLALPKRRGRALRAQVSG